MWCKLVTLLIAVGASAVSAQRGELLAVGEGGKST